MQKIHLIIITQVLGHKEGLDMMERADPLFLLIGLPAIPVGLILGKMIQWDEYLLTWWRKNAYKFTLLNSILPGWVVDRYTTLESLVCHPNLSAELEFSLFLRVSTRSSHFKFRLMFATWRWSLQPCPLMFCSFIVVSIVLTALKYKTLLLQDPGQAPSSSFNIYEANLLKLQEYRDYFWRCTNNFQLWTPQCSPNSSAGSTCSRNQVHACLLRCHVLSYDRHHCGKAHVQNCEWKLTTKYSGKVQSNFHHTRGITPKRVAGDGIDLRGVAPGHTETSERWRAADDTVSDLPARETNQKPPALIAMSWTVTPSSQKDVGLIFVSSYLIFCFSFQGGIAFVAIKGFLKIYLKQQVYSRLGRRRITDFDEGEGTPTWTWAGPTLFYIMTCPSPHEVMVNWLWPILLKHKLC